MITSSKKMGFTRVDKFLRLEPKDDDDLSLVDEILPIVLASGYLLQCEGWETVKLVSKRWRKAFLELSSLNKGWPYRSCVKVHSWHVESHLERMRECGLDKDEDVMWMYDPKVQWRLTTHTLCRHVFEKLEEIRCSFERRPEGWGSRRPEGWGSRLADSVCRFCGFPSKEKAPRPSVRWGCHVKSASVRPVCVTVTGANAMWFTFTDLPSSYPPRVPSFFVVNALLNTWPRPKFCFSCAVTRDFQLLRYSYRIHTSNGREIFDVQNVTQNVSMWDEAFFWKGLLKEARDTHMSEEDLEDELEQEESEEEE